MTRAALISQTASGACRLALLLLMLLPAAACASNGEKPAPAAQDAQQGAAQSAFEEQDIFEPFNRYVFEVNIFLDDFLLKPMATWYAGLLPPFARAGVGRFFDNLKSPVVLTNNLLQGDRDAARTTLTRFAINSSIGFLGFLDIAAERGHPPHKTDFGQTAGGWGVPHGPFLMLPFFGPATARDALGIGVDAAFDPLSYNLISPRWILPGLSGWRVVNARSQYLGKLDSLYGTSVDPYASMRSLYFQSRINASMRSEELDVGDLPDIDEFDFDAFGADESDFSR